MDYTCQVCNKQYSSYQSLWIHNKNFHKIICNKSKENINIVKNNKDSSYLCKFCNKSFSYKQSRCDHEKNYCKLRNQDLNEINKMKEETKQKELELKIKQEEADILRLKLKLQQNDKKDTITLKKLNKLLVERNNRIKNINSNNTTNNNQQINNQQIINNIQLIGFGKEEVVDTLSNYEKRIIMNSKYSSLDKLIEIVHCGKYNQFKNIIITNMKDNYMYKYDEKQGCFILSTKIDVINSLIDYRVSDLEIIYNDLLEKNKLDEKTKECIEKFINKINNDESKYTDYDGKEHSNYKQYKINEIKMLLFNNQDKITNDISLLLSTEEKINENN
jgi:hypothetical protein